MKRRKLLAGIGSACAGLTAVIGTGAVSSVTGDRVVSATIAPDFETPNSPGAYLQLSDTGEVAIPNLSKGTLVLDYTRLNDIAIGEGFNPNSTYEIVGEDDGVFQIQNQGTNPIEIAAVTADSPEDIPKRVDPSTLPYDPENIADDGPRIELFDVEDPSRTAITDDSRYRLGIGDYVSVGTRVVVPDIPPGTYHQVIVLHARAPE